MLTAKLEYIDLLTLVAESGTANAGPARSWPPALMYKVLAPEGMSLNFFLCQNRVFYRGF